MDRYTFAPDPSRTALIDRAIRQALASSVARVLAEAARHGIAHGLETAAWQEALLAGRRAPPIVWACYHDLVQAVLRADADAVIRLAHDLVARPPDHPGEPGTVLNLSEDRLGPTDAARYRAVIDNDPRYPLDLRPASDAEAERIRTLVGQGRTLLGEVDPALLDEIDTLGHQIVLATNAGGGFGGAATVFLWGAVILNPNRVPDRVTLVEGLAHETAHALLFGLTLGADLTTNGRNERYASPLRPDPRPIEGIVHATYVLARMNHALGSLQRAQDLDDGERAQIAAKRARNRASYEAGLGVVREHARFTPEGETIFAACEAAMKPVDA